MKQILQSLKDGTIELADLPNLRAGSGQLLIDTTTSLVSAGTERMLVDFGRAGWLSKARQQPDKVRQVLNKVRTDGLATTVDAVRSKLDEPLPLGYCNVGRVSAVGVGVEGFLPGDRVASNGAHAEQVVVPRNLCARVPDAVSDEEAAFAVVGAIALQGIRLAKPTLGECFVVTGLGLIGLMTVQLLRANGCRVLGVDSDSAKLEMARGFGAETAVADGEEPMAAATAFSRGRGVDGVLLTLAASSDEPVSQAARMCRKRGRLVLVGVTGLRLSRADFYQKELSFQVSCSYGPGRYDDNYEANGQDYPVGFVRWTEQRNFEAVLDMMATGALDVKPLITHRFRFDEAPRAYDMLVAGTEPYLGVLLTYAGLKNGGGRSCTVQLAGPAATAAQGPVSLGVLGAGNYAGRVLIPAFAGTGAVLHSIANRGGISGAHYAKRYGFRQVTTDVDGLFADPDISAVVIATRHDSHARFVCEALAADKHVFVEKPLCLTSEELEQIKAQAESRPSHLLMVGFNRRFSSLVVKMKALLSTVSEPKSFVVTVNAGPIPAEHWTQDPAVGGGRIIGEACHFVDLLRYLVGSTIIRWQVTSMTGAQSMSPGDDCATISLRFEDGSIGTINYFANGHKAVAKERLEVYCAGRYLVLDNFRQLRGQGWAGFKRMRLWRQDKGQRACADAFVSAVRDGGSEPIPLAELLEVSRVSIACGELARRG